MAFCPTTHQMLNKFYIEIRPQNVCLHCLLDKFTMLFGFPIPLVKTPHPNSTLYSVGMLHGASLEDLI